MFILLLSFFLRRKEAAMLKGAHAAGFSRFNLFVMYSIYVLLFMRIVGSVYTFIVGIVSLTPFFYNEQWALSYQILDDLVFPIRDFVEVMFFSYLFHFQSKKESRLEQVNRKWSEINASAKLPDKSTTDRDESTARQNAGLDGENLLGDISSHDDH
jgi:hypothetical protein